jgi:biopolymer transport protein ExbD
MDWLVRFDVVVLGLLLACTVAVVVRVSRRYHTARRDGEISTATGKKLIAELNIQVGNLKSIASTAPYVGLVGTCFGLLGAFSGVGMQRDAAFAWMTSKIAAALVPAAAGIIVAVPATCGYEYGRTRLELLVNEQPGRKRLLLTGRFTELPPFALVAAYGLVILIQAYGPFSPVHTPKGFDIGLASARCESNSDRFIVLHIANGGRIFLNHEEEQDWSTLQNRLSEIYSMRAERILYLLADEGVPFQTVADAIDAVQNAPEGATSGSLNVTVRLITSSRCPAPVVIPVSPYRSR